MQYKNKLNKKFPLHTIALDDKNFSKQTSGQIKPVASVFN